MKGKVCWSHVLHEVSGLWSTFESFVSIYIVVLHFLKVITDHLFFAGFFKASRSSSFSKESFVVTCLKKTNAQINQPAHPPPRGVWSYSICRHKQIQSPALSAALYDSTAIQLPITTEQVSVVGGNKEHTHFQGNSSHVVINSCSEIFKASFQLSVDGSLRWALPPWRRSLVKSLQLPVASCLL